MNSDAPVFSVDIHGDILMDVLYRRRMGETHVLSRQHLPGFQQAGIRIQVLPIFVEGDDLPEGGLRHAMRSVDALYQEVKESPEYFSLVLNRRDLDKVLEQGKIALILSFEGAEPLDRDVELVRVFQHLGLRMLGLTWNRANVVAQGLTENTGAGVSSLGITLLKLMDELGIILDLTHMSPASFWSALEHYKGPVLASHSNALSVHAHPRNLNDEQIQAVAKRGGVIGLNFLPRFVGGSDLLEGLVRHADYMRKLVGLDVICLGPDFTDYFPPTPSLSGPDTLLNSDDPEAAPGYKPPAVTILPELWKAFRKAGWSVEDTAAIFGGNALRFLRDKLPE